MQASNDPHIPISSSDLNHWSLSNIICVMLIALTIYIFVSIKQASKRKSRFHSPTKYIEKGKIIIALEIRDFVVKLSQKYLHGYLPLNIQVSTSMFEALRRKIFNIGYFYKPIFPASKIKEFMLGLSSIPKISLMLYTSLEPEVAEVLLYKLGIDKCFPVDMRKYCDLQNHDDQKHAIGVDQDSRRVIIVTPTHNDHQNEDEKYFLVLRPKIQESSYLKNQLKSLRNFLQKNSNINNLHEQLGQFKAVIDSESSDYDM